MPVEQNVARGAYEEVAGTKVVGESEPLVEVAFLDVGQGDTIVVALPELREAIVIDCVDAAAVFRYLKNRGIRRVRALIITHIHLDHYRGAVEFLQNSELELEYPCEVLYYNWPWRGQPKTPELQDLDDPDGHAVAGSPTSGEDRVRVARGLYDWTRANPWAPANLATGGAGCPFPGPFEGVVDLLQPLHSDLPELLAKGLNHTSAVIRVTGRGARALLTGDLEPASWIHLRGRCDDLRAEVLKFPHHGGWSGDETSVGQVLQDVDPAFVVISVGTNGIRYGHPADQVFAAIARRAPRTRLLCTQVTPKCGGDREMRSQVVPLLERHADNLGREPLLASQGCPCAGTVIISLDGEARVVQPLIPFHQEQIIRANYGTHQCRLF